MTNFFSNRRTVIVAAVTALSWLGVYVHNVVDLPGLSILSPGNSLTALVSFLLFAGWWRLPYKRLMAWLLIVWATLYLIGGGVITVIPFSFLPFYPEQSLKHYLAHVLYGATQLPLLVILARQLRHSP